MPNLEITIEGVDTAGTDRRRLARLAALAVNKTTKSARARAARRIRQEVSLPASYVSPAAGRFVAKATATPDKLESQIVARFRATSLARFAKRIAGRRGMLVQVAPGRARLMRRAFLIRLRQGDVLTDTKHNMGLAIRLRRGEQLRNKKYARRMSDGLYLLYGPSVYQAFIARSGHGIAEAESPWILRTMQREFERLVELKGVF